MKSFINELLTDNHFRFENNILKQLYMDKDYLIKKMKLFIDKQSKDNFNWGHECNSLYFFIKNSDKEALEIALNELSLIYELPFNIVLALFEKILLLDKEKKYVSFYAEYLYLHGPDYDEYANQLCVWRKLADQPKPINTQIMAEFKDGYNTPDSQGLPKDKE